jgi:hypothetical protein
MYNGLNRGTRLSTLVARRIDWYRCVLGGFRGNGMVVRIRYLQDASQTFTVFGGLHTDVFSVEVLNFLQLFLTGKPGQ